jgi:hypothetical protein
MPTPSRRALRHVLVALAAAGSCTIGMATRAPAQSTAIPAEGWTWAQLRATPGADTAQVGWLEANVPRPEAVELFAMLAALSRPEAVQLLPSLAYLEGVLTSPTQRAFVDSFSVRPPSGLAGTLRSAYLLARTRHDIIGSRRGTYVAEFAGRPFTLPPAPSTAPQRGVTIRLTLDFAPAETLLAIVTTPDVRYEDALARISTPAFDALVSHHNQAFYPVALTREQLALNLVHAASTQPLDRLYRWARPNGLYHFADVAVNAARYRQLFDELRRHEGDIARYTSAALAPYVPAGTRLDRRLSFFFNDLADGWASGNLAAVPIEYYKDDYVRMVNTLVHESFHAAQSAVRAASAGPARTLTSAADTALARAAGTLLNEGTANFIAPAIVRSPASADSMSRVASGLLAELATMRGGSWNGARAGEILNKGVASGGPFYWLGAAMAGALVAHDGPAAIGRALQSDGLELLRTYVVRSQGMPDGLLSPAVAEWVRTLTDRR